MIAWQLIRGEFRRDGSLRDLYVLDTSEDDWDRLFAHLDGWGHSTSFWADGEREDVPPSFRDGFHRHQEASVTLGILVSELQLNCHFFSPDQIELDIDPAAVNEHEFRHLSDFMRRVGDLLGKPVVLTPENLPEEPFLRYLPSSGQFEYVKSSAV